MRGSKRTVSTAPEDEPEALGEAGGTDDAGSARTEPHSPSSQAAAAQAEGVTPENPDEPTTSEKVEGDHAGAATSDEPVGAQGEDVSDTADATEPSNGAGAAENGGAAIPAVDRSAHRFLLWTRVVLIVLVLTLGAGVVLLVRVIQADTETSDRVSAMDAARTVAQQLVTLDAADAPQHMNVMLGLATDPFRQQLTGLSAAFAELLKQGQVASQGTVDSVGVESIGNGEAHVMATANTVVRNTQIPNGTPRDYRLQIGVREVDGQWRVSSVDVAK